MYNLSVFADASAETTDFYLSSATALPALPTLPTPAPSGHSSPNALPPPLLSPTSPSTLSVKRLQVDLPVVSERDEPTLPCDVNADSLAAARHAWLVLEDRFPRTRLLKHVWEWKDGDWLPFYAYPGRRVTTVTDVWNDWVDGYEGSLSGRDLEQHWGAKWRRSVGKLRTESSRRTKVIELIEGLGKKTNWTTKIAMRFLTEKYLSQFTSFRQFYDFISKSGAKEQIFESSDHFFSH